MSVAPTRRGLLVAALGVAAIVAGWLLGLPEAAFTGVAAVALLIMMGMMIAIYKSVSGLRERSTLFLDRWEPVADDAKKTLLEFRTQSTTILSDVKKLTESGREQMARVETLLGEVETTTRSSLARVDESLQQNLRRVDETAEAVQRTVLTPVRQVRGMAAAIDAGALERRRQRGVPAVHDHVDSLIVGEPFFQIRVQVGIAAGQNEHIADHSILLVTALSCHRRSL